MPISLDKERLNPGSVHRWSFYHFKLPKHFFARASMLSPTVYIPLAMISKIKIGKLYSIMFETLKNFSLSTENLSTKLARALGGACFGLEPHKSAWNGLQLRQKSHTPTFLVGPFWMFWPLKCRRDCGWNPLGLACTIRVSPSHFHLHTSRLISSLRRREMSSERVLGISLR